MPVTGWLRGTVKAVPSGDTVLIVANAGPTVRFCLRVFLFWGFKHRRIFSFFPTEDDDAFALYVSSVFLLSVLGRDHKASLIVVVSETPLVTLSSFDERSPKSSFPDIALLSLTLLEPPFRCFLSPPFQSAGPPPEKIVTLAGIIAPRMVRRFVIIESFFLLLLLLLLLLRVLRRRRCAAFLFSRGLPRRRFRRRIRLKSLLVGRGDATKARAGGFFCHSLSLSRMRRRRRRRHHRRIMMMMMMMMTSLHSLLLLFP